MHATGAVASARGVCVALAADVAATTLAAIPAARACAAVPAARACAAVSTARACDACRVRGRRFTPAQIVAAALPNSWLARAALSHGCTTVTGV